VGGSNNCTEFMALKLLLKLVADKGVSILQGFGDSFVVLKWIISIYKTRKLIIQTIIDEIKGMEIMFCNISYHHVYIELNTVANGLSKYGIQM
jgi:hypothetical protein